MRIQNFFKRSTVFTSLMKYNLLRICIVSTLLLIPTLTFGVTESRTWIGSGSAYGRYIEKDSKIDEELSGKSNEVVLYHRKGDWGITSGIGFMESEIDQKFNDESGFTHEIYYRNISGYLLLGLKLKILFANISGHGIIGISETSFQKKYSSSADSFIEYPRIKTRSLITGSEGLIFFDLEDNWIIGGKMGTYNRTLEIELGNTNAEIIQDKNFSVFVGINWGGTSSAKTKKKK